MIKVFVIDDSALVRNQFKKIFAQTKDIELIGTANNPVDAFEVFKKVGLPDVFILDIEMPKMDGLTFLAQINKQKPTPVIICSTLVKNGSKEAVDALRLGAVDIILKPSVKINEFFDENVDEVIQLVRAASKAKVRVVSEIKRRADDHTLNELKDSSSLKFASKKIVAIGSSTGGVQVIEEILLGLKANHPAIVITQHMQAGFTASFAQRLNELIPNSTIKEAQEGDVILPSHVYIAPGNIHMEVKKNKFAFVIALKDYPRVNSHKPSVNVLFSSMAKEVGGMGVGIILTGMGDDGAVKLKAMREAGAKTYAQDETTCTVYGMPKKAVEIGAVDESLSIKEIIELINSLS